MKFQPDTLDGVNVLSRYETSRVWVNGAVWQSSLMVPWRGSVRSWGTADFSALGAEHFDALLDAQPEVVIFGSGTRLRFPAPALLRGLINKRIGIETMDLGAACRTYNVLAAEGRSVVAALLIETGAA
jgi:uncharacterized protein